MSITETLRECHAIVWAARAELEAVWPTPNTEDALLFAFTELGEAIDAHLRTKGEYARNRDKDLSVLDELADCAMMLLTALGAEPFNRRGLYPFLPSNFYDLTTSVALAMVEEHGCGSWLDHAHKALTIIMHYPGMDLPARLTARLDRIKAKRLLPPPLAINDAYEQRRVAHESEAA